MSICQHGPLGQHRFEYQMEMQGQSYWICINANCGELKLQFEDLGSGA
jgi:hypothetical protein